MPPAANPPGLRPDSQEPVPCQTISPTLNPAHAILGQVHTAITKQVCAGGFGFQSRKLLVMFGDKEDAQLFLQELLRTIEASDKEPDTETDRVDD